MQYNFTSSKLLVLNQLIWESVIIPVKNEAVLEIPDTAENLSAMNPSFGEIISQLNLNKVVGKYT